MIAIQDLVEFRRLELSIVKIINSTPNGGRLFVTDPFRLLAEIGVELSPTARRELEAELPHTGGFPLSSYYDAIHNSAPNQHVKVIVRGILRK